MNELIPVNYEKEVPTVSGRDLHKFLEIETKYSDWFPRMVEYGFTEGIDHCSFLSNGDGFGKFSHKCYNIRKVILGEISGCIGKHGVPCVGKYGFRGKNTKRLKGFHTKTRVYFPTPKISLIFRAKTTAKFPIKSEKPALLRAFLDCAKASILTFLSGCGDRIWTYDLRVMRSVAGVLRLYIMCWISRFYAIFEPFACCNLLSIMLIFYRFWGLLSPKCPQETL